MQRRRLSAAGDRHTDCADAGLDRPTQAGAASKDWKAVLPDGSGLEQLTSVNEGCAEFPNWSADGSKIAFDTDCDGPNAIYVMDPTTQKMTTPSEFKK